MCSRLNVTRLHSIPSGASISFLQFYIYECDAHDLISGSHSNRRVSNPICTSELIELLEQNIVIDVIWELTHVVDHGVCSTLNAHVQSTPFVRKHFRALGDEFHVCKASLYIFYYLAHAERVCVVLRYMHCAPTAR